LLEFPLDSVLHLTRVYDSQKASMTQLQITPSERQLR